MTRFGYAVRIGGDPEIAGALAAGIEAGTPAGDAKMVAGDQEIVAGDREIAPTGRSEAVRRVDMMQHTHDEWEELIEDARVCYGGQSRPPEGLGKALLVGYALVCYAVSLGWRWLMESMGM